MQRWWDKVADFEYEMFVYLLEKFPSGILSLVMDTFDYEQLLNIALKQKILFLQEMVN
jgi:hypothetical protein